MFVIPAEQPVTELKTLSLRAQAKQSPRILEQIAASFATLIARNDSKVLVWQQARRQNCCYSKLPFQ